MYNNFPLSDKYVDFLEYKDADAEFLEGTTAAGKTTVGVVKFMIKVNDSDKKLHIIACKSVGVAEKNIINSEKGLLDVFYDADYKGNGDKDNKISHIKYNDKIIYVIGYDDTAKWKMILRTDNMVVFI